MGPWVSNFFTFLDSFGNFGERIAVEPDIFVDNAEEDSNFDAAAPAAADPPPKKKKRRPPPPPMPIESLPEVRSSPLLSQILVRTPPNLLPVFQLTHWSHCSLAVCTCSFRIRHYKGVSPCFLKAGSRRGYSESCSRRRYR